MDIRYNAPHRLGGFMKIGTLVRHRGLCEDIGVVVFLMGVNTASVYFPRLNKTMAVFIDDTEVICE